MRLLSPDFLKNVGKKHVECVSSSVYSKMVIELWIVLQRAILQKHELIWRKMKKRYNWLSVGSTKINNKEMQKLKEIIDSWYPDLYLDENDSVWDRDRKVCTSHKIVALNNWKSQLFFSMFHRKSITIVSRRERERKREREERSRQVFAPTLKPQDVLPTYIDGISYTSDEYSDWIFHDSPCFLFFTLTPSSLLTWLIVNLKKTVFYLTAIFLLAKLWIAGHFLSQIYLVKLLMKREQNCMNSQFSKTNN